MLQKGTEPVIYKYSSIEFICSEDLLVKISEKVNCSFELNLILIALLEWNETPLY